MEFNKDKIQDLMNEWIIFRDEELCKLTKILWILILFII